MLFGPRGTLRWAGRNASEWGVAVDEWHVMVGDGFLITAALVGAVVTVVRRRQTGTRPTTLAATACAITLAAGICDLFFRMAMSPDLWDFAAGDDAALDHARRVSGLASAGYTAAIAIGVVLFLCATLLARQPTAAVADTRSGESAYVAGEPTHTHQPSLPTARHAAPAAGAVEPYGAGQPTTAARRPQRGARHSAEPATRRSGEPAETTPVNGGWTPPQQAQPDDWSIMSGVWSIPRGTFDDPPRQ